MNCRRLITFAFLILFPCTTIGQTLSVSEQAAASERKPTASEQKLRQAGCSWSEARGKNRVSPVSGVVGRTVTLNQISIVKAMQVKRIAKGENGFAVERFAPLPNGGIAGKDFCGFGFAFTFENPDRMGAVIQFGGVVLRDGLDLAADYPNTAQTIRSGGYETTTDGGLFAVFDFSKPKTKEWFSSQAGSWSGRRKGSYAFVLSERLYYPVNGQ